MVLSLHFFVGEPIALRYQGWWCLSDKVLQELHYTVLQKYRESTSQGNFPLQGKHRGLTVLKYMTLHSEHASLIEDDRLYSLTGSFSFVISEVCV